MVHLSVKCAISTIAIVHKATKDVTLAAFSSMVVEQRWVAQAENPNDVILCWICDC